MTQATHSDLSRFDYALEPSLIALEPGEERDGSRLLVYDRKRKTIAHRQFRALPEYLHPSDLLAINDTRVFPARLRGIKKTGGKMELLLLRPISGSTEKGRDPHWEVLLKGRGVPPLDLLLNGNVSGRILRNLEGGRKELVLHLSGSLFPNINIFMEKWGETPLPPYILKQRSGKSPSTRDPKRYQTVFAKHPGSAAAPTAGLHFSEGLLREIHSLGVQTATTTLHIGLDTFRPIASQSILDHKMHREWFQVSEATANRVNETRERKGKVVAVGTTVVRALESASRTDGRVQAAEGETALFITPGYRFRGIDALITNFHLPKSTLLVMVSAFAGHEAVKRIYEEAIQQQYRFYSYGDAMLIL